VFEEVKAAILKEYNLGAVNTGTTEE